jgi:hypothetical protein
MKTKFKCMLLGAMLIGIINLVPLMAKAQISFGGTEDPDAPIDGGVSVLIVAGVGYGIKKAKENRKKKMMNSEDENTIK